MSMVSDRTTTLIVPALGVVWQRLEPLAYALARWTIGAILAIHGAARLRLIDIGGPTIESTARFNAAMHLQPSLFWSYYVTGLELLGGVLLFIGLFTRPVAALLVAFLLVATLYVTPHFGFWSRDGGVEYAAVLLVLTLSILVRGGGYYSLDQRLGREF